jgi:LysR family transcriptional regulator, nitrogen assimilation regulatory protein
MDETAINLRQLRYFMKVVEARNITRASEQLNVAQPALGLKIRQLEDMFGVPLLHRHSRGVDPTPAGELLYTRARAVFGLLGQTRKDVQSLGQQVSRHLTLGLTPSLVMLVGAEAVMSARRQLDSISLSLREDPSFVLTDAVESKEVDVALAYAVTERPSLHLTPVLREELLLVTRADQAPAGDVVTLEQALDRPIAHGGKRDTGRCTVAAAARRHDIAFDVTFEMQSIAGIREMVLRGLAATVLPYGSVARELASGELAARRISDPELTQTLFIVRRANDEEGDVLKDGSLSAYLHKLGDLIAEKQGSLAQRLHAGA